VKVRHTADVREVPLPPVIGTSKSRLSDPKFTIAVPTISPRPVMSNAPVQVAHRPVPSVH
jgi:hypothetical protein